MRRFVAFPGIAVLLLVVAASGWTVAPVAGGSAGGPAGALSWAVADVPSGPSGSLAPAAAGTLGVRGTSGSRASSDGPQHHVLGRLGIRGDSAAPTPGAATAPVRESGLPPRTPLPPFVTTLPPPADVRS